MKKPRFIKSDYQHIKDIDYAHKLSDDERNWLNTFLQNEYNAYFYGDGLDVVNASEKKKLNKNKQRRLKDFYNKCRREDLK